MSNAAPDVTLAIRKTHDFLTVGAPHPLQCAGVRALEMPASYYAGLARDYAARRDILSDALRAAAFDIVVPEGAYYIMADISRFGFPDDAAFCQWLVREVGVAAVPGSSFFRHPDMGRHLVRFAFCKREETLREAASRLGRVPELVRRRT